MLNTGFKIQTINLYLPTDLYLYECKIEFIGIAIYGYYHHARPNGSMQF